ncbi:hypothetical protein AAG570_004448 [Ranatra chinensis]|uniref:Uncharacterized protein n=1 Tax=Ranatra chinensis TaxID=642074 RepID=A0ABD0Y2D4_9HEMI
MASKRRNMFYESKKQEIVSSMMDAWLTLWYLQVIWTWSYCLGMPLLASDLVVYAGLPLDTTPLNLVIPAYTLIQYHLGSNLPVDVDLLRISHFSSTLLMLVVSLLCERVTAFWTAFLYTIAFSNVELDDIDDGSKAALWAILVSAANLRLLPALRLDL